MFCTKFERTMGSKLAKTFVLVLCVFVGNILIINVYLTRHMDFVAEHGDTQPRQLKPFLDTSANVENAVLREESIRQQKWEGVQARNATMHHIPRSSYAAVFDATFGTSSDVPLIRRRMTKANHIMQINLLRDFLKFLEEHNVPYVIAYGTLMGSYLFHDVIPWDDDVDLHIPLTHINNLRAIMRKSEFTKTFRVVSFHDPWNTYNKVALESNVSLTRPEVCVAPPKNKSLTPDTKCRYKGKVFYKHTFWGNATARFPFIDFVFYVERGRFVESFDYVRAGKVIYFKEDFFPFHLRPFNVLWLPAPRRPRACLIAKYGKFMCKGSAWDHMNEDMAKFGLHKGGNKCKDVPKYYPYVRRKKYQGSQTPGGESLVEEELVYKEKVLYSLLVTEPYEGPMTLSIT